MSTDLILNGPTNLPAHLQGQNLGLTANILATMGAAGNRIGLKGNRFRVVISGKEETVMDENYLDVIVVGIVPHISRMYYEGEYEAGSKTPPTCFSEDGNAPPLDLATRQSDKCDTCKWNEKGSKIVNGQKMKACGFFQRLVVMFPGDPDRRLYKLDVKSQGIFGESYPKLNKYNIREYGKALANRSIDICLVVTRLSFDTESSVPKLLFSPVGFVQEADFLAVKEAVPSDEVKQMLRITASTVDLSHETDTEDTPAASAEPVTPAAKVEADTKVETAPAPPAPQPKAEEPKQYRAIKEKLGDFTVQQYLDSGWTKEALIEAGMIEEVKPEPPKPAAPPAPPKPAAPPAPPKPAAPPAPPKPAAPKPAAVAPAVVEQVPMPGAQKAAAVQEVGTDKELADMIADLL